MAWYARSRFPGRFIQLFQAAFAHGSRGWVEDEKRFVVIASFVLAAEGNKLALAVPLPVVMGLRCRRVLEICGPSHAPFGNICPENKLLLGTQKPLLVDPVFSLPAGCPETKTGIQSLWWQRNEEAGGTEIVSMDILNIKIPLRMPAQTFQFGFQTHKGTKHL